MLVRRDDTTAITPSRVCSLWDYALPSNRLGLATARINGRYPDTGKVLNRVCDKTYLVTSGSAVVHVEAGDFAIGAGDAFFFEHGKWHWVEGKDLHVVVCHTPPWTAEQHAVVP